MPCRSADAAQNNTNKQMKTIQLTNWKTVLKNAPKKESDALVYSAIDFNHCMKANNRNDFPAGFCRMPTTNH